MRKFNNTQLNFERLEHRRVLAGNVQALVTDGVLVVIGDQLDNQIEISQDAGGNFTVAGNDTTVNGTNQQAIFPRNFRHVSVIMHGGNDEVSVRSTRIPSNFTFLGGEGSDRLTTHGLRAYHFHAEGQAGDDVFDLTQAIDQSSYLYLGLGNDVVFAKDVASGRNFKVFAHGGDDTFVASNLNIGRKFELHMHEGQDDVLVEGSFRAGLYTLINTDSGNDFVGLLPNLNEGRGSYGSSLRISTGDGNDNVAFDSGLRGSSFVRVNGGSGIDAFQRGGASLGFNQIRDFQSNSVENLDSLIESVMNRLQDVGIGVVDEVFVPLAATASSSPLIIQENTGPTSVDSGFTLEGSDPVVTATIAISDYDNTQDELSFTSTSLVTGDFDAVTGILTLSGNGSTSTYQSAIRSVLYENRSDSPIANERQFTISVFTVDETVLVSRGFQVVNVNDGPVIELGRDSVVVEPSQLPVIIDDSISLSDADDARLTSVLITINSGFQAGDVLEAPTILGISSEYDSDNGVLTLSGDALVEEWQTVLRSVSFRNNQVEVPEGTRTIEFVVSDGSDSNAAAIDILVQTETVPNGFTVREGTPNGTVLGTIQTDTEFEGQTVYQFNDPDAPEAILLNADDHLHGDTAAPILLIDYQSYQCPACAASHEVLIDVEALYEKELMVVIRHQTLEQFLPNARAAAIVAEAAARQGKFDEMTDTLLANQADWSPETDPTAKFEQYATDLGLDITQFRNDVADPALDARVTRDQEEAIALGITSTPTFILQNEPIPNPGTVEGFEQVINEQLASNTNPVTLDRRTGEIILWDNSLLDSVTTPQITLAVLVKDTNGNEELVTVTIDVEP